MSSSPQQVIPMLSYENGVAAIEWLCRVFGFKERTKMLADNGRLAHGEISMGHGIIMLASPTPDYEGPKHHREHCEAAAKWNQSPFIIDGVLVYVDDVMKHYEHAKNAGANIITAPESGEIAPRYRVEDMEGHRWMFMQRD